VSKRNLSGAMAEEEKAPESSRRSRRRMFTCPHCGDAFIDPASFDQHLLTHVETTEDAVDEPEPVTPEPSISPDPDTIAYWQRMLAPPEPPPVPIHEIVMPRKLLTLEDFAEWVVLGTLTMLRRLVVAIVVIGLPAGLLVYYLRPAPVPVRPRPRPNVTPLAVPRPVKPPESPALKSVLRFVELLSRRAYRSAYKMLTPDWRHDLNYARFKAGYRTVKSLRARPVGEKTLRSGKVAVCVSVKVNTSEQLMTYVVKKTHLGWRLESGVAGPLAKVVGHLTFKKAR
jgi:hypothetical protein